MLLFPFHFSFSIFDFDVLVFVINNGGKRLEILLMSKKKRHKTYLKHEFLIFFKKRPTTIARVSQLMICVKFIGACVRCCTYDELVAYVTEEHVFSVRHGKDAARSWRLKAVIHNS